MSEASDILAPLEDWLRARLPDASDLRVSGLRKPGAGESSDTQLLEIDYREAGVARHIAAVLRCAPREGGPFPEYDLGMQFHVMRILGEAKRVPVPEVLWLEEDPATLGVPFLVMRAVEGNAPLDFPSYQAGGVYFDDSPEARAHMWDSTLEALARLHETPWKVPLAGIVPGTREGEDPARQCLRYWRNYLEDFLKGDDASRVPVFDDAMEWLESEFVMPDRLSLCWGDAKIGNVLYHPTTRDVAAVIDWEMASIGDPAYDLASLHLSDLRAQDGAGGVALPGTPTAKELVACYERHSGETVRNFHYALVFSTFWRGSVQLAVMRHMRARGAEIDDALFVDNFPTRILRGLLEQA